MSTTEHVLDDLSGPVRTLFWVELVCASCSDTTAGQWTDGRIRIKEVKAQAASEGWSFGGVHTFCSAACRARFVERSAARDST